MVREIKITKEQIKNGTHVDLAVWSAVYLKNWHIEHRGGSIAIWCSENGRAEEFVKSWNPAWNIGQAFELVEKLSDKYHWIIRTSFEKGDLCFVGLTLLGVTGWNGKPDIDVPVKNVNEISKGITIASLLAVLELGK